MLKSFIYICLKKLGVICSCISATCSSITFFTLKKLSMKKVHWATCSIYVCWAGIPMSLILSVCMATFGSAHQNLSQEVPHLPMDLFYAFISSSLSICAQIWMSKALIYEDATKVAILKTCDVFIACVLQYFFLGILIDYLAIIGSISIVLSTLTIIGFKIMSSRYEDFKLQKSKTESGPEGFKENVFFKVIFFQI